MFKLSLDSVFSMATFPKYKINQIGLYELKKFKMTEEKKDSKKCSGKKNIMFAYGFIQLGSSFVSAIALAAIAFGFCSVKKESKLFNKCVAEIIEDGGTNSEAVRYCNGGN